MRARNREIRSQMTDALMMEELQSQSLARQLSKGGNNDVYNSTDSIIDGDASKIIDGSVNSGVCVYPLASYTYASQKVSLDKTQTFAISTLPQASLAGVEVTDTGIVDLDTHGSTTASPIILPANYEFTTHVPVIQAFPSPPMSPTTCAYVLDTFHH